MPGKFSCPLSLLVPLRSVAPVTATCIPGSVAPAGVVTVIAMPPRPVAGAGARRTVGAGAPGAVWPGGVVGLGACAPGCAGGGVVGLAVVGGVVGRGCAGACPATPAANAPEASTQLMSSVFMPSITAENVPQDDARKQAPTRSRARCEPYNSGGRQGYPAHCAWD